MKKQIIVAVRDNDEDARDAIALGAELARATGGEVILAAGWSTLAGRASSLYDEVARDHAELLVDGLGPGVPSDVRGPTRTFTAPTLDRGLHDLAEKCDAAILVLGPSHLGPVAEELRGDRALRALHHAPCPVAIAPRGQRERPERPAHEIAVAWDGSPEARDALQHAIALARGMKAALRIIQVVDSPYRFVQYPWLDPSGESRWLAAMDKGAERSLGEAAAAVPAGMPVTTELRHGDPAQELAEATREATLVVVGSRGYGTAWRVILGSTAGGLLHQAAAPVLVVPRSSAETQESESDTALSSK